MSGCVFTRIRLQVVMSPIAPDSRFTNSDGGPTDVSSLRMSASCSDRGETDPLNPGRAFVHCFGFFCLARRFDRVLCRRFLRLWRLGLRHLLKSRRTNLVCGTLEPHRWSSRYRTDNTSRLTIPGWASTLILCVCYASAALPEPLPTQRQRNKHRTPAGPGQSHLRQGSREILTNG